MQRTSEQILDELLVLRSQSGEREALEELLGRWLARFAARARLLCGSEDGCGEVVQEAMIGMVRGLGSLDDPAAFGGWAMRIVAHKASDWIRRRKRQRKREGPLPAAEDGGEATPGTAPPPEAQERARSQILRVRLALEHLAPDRRAVLALHYGHGISIEGIARSLGIPAGTAKSRLFHARRDLERHLERIDP